LKVDVGESENEMSGTGDERRIKMGYNRYQQAPIYFLGSLGPFNRYSTNCRNIPIEDFLVRSKPCDSVTTLSITNKSHDVTTLPACSPTTLFQGVSTMANASVWQGCTFSLARIAVCGGTGGEGLELVLVVG
jgi:hypothetical protein